MHWAAIVLDSARDRRGCAALLERSEGIRADAAGTRPRFLLCPPDHYDAHFLFNPFMGHRDKVDRRRARRQWERLVDALEQAGAEVELLEPSPLSPPLVFTADAAFPYAPGRALVLRNDGPRGTFEPDAVRSWLRERGYAVEPLPPRYRLDGGNLLRLPSGDVVAGLKPGASGRAERYLGHLLAKATGRTLRGLQLVDERHLHGSISLTRFHFDRGC